ncbi:MAG: Crp/Fnr family transcriptional regulator [Acidimicrobiia bacterium]
MNRAETIALLKNVALFETLSQKDLNEVAKRTEEVDVPAGTVLTQEGRVGEQAFVIVDGSASVRRNYRQVAKLSSGDVLGEMSLVEGVPQSITVQTLEDSRLLMINRADFRYLLENVQGFAIKLLVSMSRRLREATVRLVS